MNFNAEKVTGDLIGWIRDWFEKNGPGCSAVLGISGGKDSSVCAALCAKALGPERVVGVMMPNGEQWDIDVSKRLIAHLGIRSCTINIHDAYEGMFSQLQAALPEITTQTRNNLPPRLRMSAVYAVAQSVNGRVVNTCNLSEDYVGYSTRYGDSVGDFSPLSLLCVREVRAVGRTLGLPAEFVDKVPIDGLCGKTDEDNLGFTYETLDHYIREGLCEDEAIRRRIDTLHERNLFKLQLMPVFPYHPES